MRKYCAVIIGSLVLSGCVAGGTDTGTTSQTSSGPASPDQTTPVQASQDQASLSPDALDQHQITDTEIGQAALITANIYAHDLQPTPDMTTEERTQLSATIDQLMDAVGLEQSRYFDIMRLARTDEQLEQQILSAMMALQE
jgi:PBP1b-binding outer membrane lipoprotein LpoB